MKWRVTAGELAEITGVNENTIRRLAGELREMLREVEIELER
ncbi:MAG: HTH domain-containing protein [Nitrososphaerota archaeon]|nr:HTH domain-containing protein [Nitrososphaerota archaeon]